MRLISAADTLIWPQLKRLSAARPLGDLENAMRVVASRMPSGWPVGLENLLVSPGKFGTISRGNAKFQAGLVATDRGPPDDPKYLGVPIELILKRNWGFCVDECFDPVLSISDMARHLVDVADYRVTRCFAIDREAGIKIEYEKPAKIPTRIRKFARNAARQQGLSPVYHAIGLMMEFLVIHPFPDGNGRLSRAVFQLALARELKLDTPIFPLLPVTLYQRRALYEAYLKWETMRDCSDVCLIIEQWLCLLVRYYQNELNLAPDRHATPAEGR